MILIVISLALSTKVTKTSKHRLLLTVTVGFINNATLNQLITIFLVNWKIIGVVKLLIVMVGYTGVMPFLFLTDLFTIAIQWQGLLQYPRSQYLGAFCSFLIAIT